MAEEDILTRAAAAMGRKGGKSKSPAKKAAGKINIAKASSTITSAKRIEYAAMGGRAAAAKMSKAERSAKMKAVWAKRRANPDLFENGGTVLPRWMRKAIARHPALQGIDISAQHSALSQLKSLFSDPNIPERVLAIKVKAYLSSVECR